MKIRSSLVSNSSSSSFILLLKEVPTSVKELQDLLFKNETTFRNQWNRGEDWSTETIAEIIFHQLSEAEPLTLDEAQDILSDGGCYQLNPNWSIWDTYWDLPKEERNVRIQKWQDEVETNTAKFLKELPDDIKMIELVFSDDMGPLDISIEHGNTFHRVEHLHISHH